MVTTLQEILAAVSRPIVLPAVATPVEPERLALPVPQGKENDPDRVSPKLTQAIDWLRTNRDKAALSDRVLAEMIGVNRTTVNQAKKALTN